MNASEERFWANAAGVQVAVARLEVVRVAADGGLGADAGAHVEMVHVAAAVSLVEMAHVADGGLGAAAGANVGRVRAPAW